MSERIQAIRGMNDVLPEEMPLWHKVESTLKQCLAQYGYEEIRFPIVESTGLFSRTIGEVTDIVEKEMYTFNDRNGDSLTLRPEGTAGCVRACLEHGLLHNQQQKLWYMGPVFRHEKPQKGRYRQFTQFGVEAFGYSSVAIELELLAMCYRLWQALGLADNLQLQINTLGELSERQAYRSKLTDYLKSHWNDLDEDSKHRLDKNPLRILDSKNPQLKSIIDNAPKLIDVVSEESRSRFYALCKGLDVLEIPYKVNPLLVRGLDYYGGVVFEWVTEHLGSQATVCAGGRFDKLVEQLGGQPTSAIGFAMGVERLVLLLQALQQDKVTLKQPYVYLMGMGEEALVRCMSIAESLRHAFPDSVVFVNTAGGSFKSQFKKADKSGARFALIIGDEELANRSISIKDLRHNGEQLTLSQDGIIEYLNINSLEK